MPSREQMIDRQQVLADFGELALRSDDLDEILTQACRLISKALNTGLAKILEIEHEQQTLLVRAGVGWGPGIVGKARLPMGELSSETYSINKGEPVTTSDIHRETRFGFPAFMREAGVIGIANVPIFLPGGRPYGLLQVDSRRHWTPDPQDIEFLRTYATILGPVIDRLLKVRDLQLAVERNETLLRELQHRIKNNVGAIMSLIRMRMSKVESQEVREELGIVADRVEALRLVHEQVYAAKAIDRLPLRPYVVQLLEGLLDLHREIPVRLDVQIDDIEITSDTAIPLGLILNEFTTNSLKHAFGELEGGCIAIRTCRRGDRLSVRISDNGKGLPVEAQEMRPGSGTGRALIEGLSRQIGAEPQWSSRNGTALCLEFRRRRSGAW